MVKNKINLYTILLCVLCFICGAFAGYLFGVNAGNNAHSTDIEIYCPDGSLPDKNGCCPGETYTDMADLGFNCCPEGDGDCYPPIK